jgi:hypothetical protein
MATKAEMRVEIEALAREQGVEITADDLDRMNHPDMTSLLEAFRAQAQTVASDEVEAVEEPTETERAEIIDALAVDSPLTAPPTATVDGDDAKSLGGPPPKDRPNYRYPYTVAQGCSVTTSRRGTIGAFARVCASDFAGGQAQLDELVASGHVAKK